MNAAQTIAIQAHSAAIIQLLLNGEPVKPELAFLGGTPLTVERRISTAQIAIDMNMDLVHCGFSIAATGEPVFESITVFLPRDGACYLWTDCQLSLGAGETRAVLTATPGVRGHFYLLPDEIVRDTHTPAWLAEGIARATDRVAAILCNSDGELSPICPTR